MRTLKKQNNPNPNRIKALPKNINKSVKEDKKAWLLEQIEDFLDIRDK